MRQNLFWVHISKLFQTIIDLFFINYYDTPMFLCLFVYASFLCSLSPSSRIETYIENDRHYDVLSRLPHKESFYKEGLLYFLKSSSLQDYERRVAKWCARFDIPREFDRRWTSLWYGHEKVVPFEDIKRRWKDDHGLDDSFRFI